MTALRPFSVLLLSAALIALGCGGTAPTEQASEAPATETPSAAQPESVVAVFNHYEQARALLAADKTEGLAAAAEAIRQSANAAKADVNEGAAAHLGMVADESAKLAAADIEQARLAFGEVSRHLVQAVVADASLAGGRVALHCPMAQGYQHWIQTSETVSNPYMGMAMLECGAPEKFEEAAAPATN